MVVGMEMGTRTPRAPSSGTEAMSQRGRGSGRGGDDHDFDDRDAADEQHGDEPLLPPVSARPIAPYDPYRPRSADAYAPPRRPARPSASDPFLPDDDPLNADAWQLELDEIEIVEDPALTESDLAAAPQPRRVRRAPTPARAEREPRAGARPARRARPRPGAAREASTRGAMTIGVPRVVAGSPLVADQTALILLGISAASILLMALLLGVRLGGVPSPTVLRLDAAGNPDRWGPPGILWRLPLISFFTTVMFLVVAWFLYPTDRFGARLALAATLVVQLIAWVAVIQHVG
jgi:hypothetical protein